MGTIKRQSIFSTIFLYMGIAIGYVNVTLLYPTILGSEGFGFTRFLISAGAILGVFGQIGFGGVILRFFPFFQDNENQHNGFLGLSLAFSLIGVILVTLFIIFFKSWVIEQFSDPKSLDIITRYYLLLIPAFVFTVYYNILQAYSSSLLKAAMPLFFREVFARLFSLALLIVYYFEWVTFEQFMYIFVLEGGFRTIGMLIYLKWLRQLSFKVNWGILQQPIFKQMMEYALYILLANSSGLLITGLDIMMISAFMGFGFTGIYFAFLAATRLITVPVQSINAISSPIVSKAWKENNLLQINYLYKKTAITQLVIGLLLFIGVWANLDNLCFILGHSGEDYFMGRSVAIFIGLGSIVDLMTGINGAILIHSKYYRWNLIFVLFLVGLTYTTNYLLIPTYGITGAGLATMITVIIYNVLKMVFVWVKFNMHPFTKEIWITLILGFAILLLNFQLPYAGEFQFLRQWTNNYWLWLLADIAYRSVIITILYVGGTLYLNVSEDITKMIHNIFQQFLQFFRS